MRRLGLLQQSKPYTQARSIPPNDENQAKLRSDLFRQAKAAHGFSEYALSRYATGARRTWLGEHIDIHTTQKLAKRTFFAVSKVAFGKAKKARFKGKRGLRSLEGKRVGIGYQVERGSCSLVRPEAAEGLVTQIAQIVVAEKNSLTHG